MKSFKALLLLLCLALLLITSPLFSADYRIWDPKDGLPIRQGTNLKWSGSSHSDNQGNICVVWADTRSGDIDIWGQLINANGEQLWAENGVLISGAARHQLLPDVISDGEGNWIISWIDYRNDEDYSESGDVYIQKLDSNGDAVWLPENGIPLCTNEERQYYVELVSDGNGGAIACWSDARNNDIDIFGQHIDQNGNILWQTDGLMIAGGVGDQGTSLPGHVSVTSDNAGGMFIAWRDSRNPIDLNLYCNRINSEGELVWADSSGMTLCNVFREQRYVRVASDGSDGAFFVWGDNRNYSETYMDIYGQYILDDGTTVWNNNGEILCNNPENQRNVRLITSDEDEIILVWENLVQSVDKTDLYVQKVSNNNGNPLLHWGEIGNELDGLLVCDAFDDQNSANLVSDGNGGAYISWLDNRDTEDYFDDLYGLHLTTDGSISWGENNGQLICESYLGLSGNRILSFNSQLTGYFWADYRMGYPQLRYQILTSDGTEILQENGEQLSFGVGYNGYKPEIIESDENTAFVIWSDDRYGRMGDYPFAQKINITSGETLEESNGFPIFPGYPFGESDTLQFDARDIFSISDDNGGFFTACRTQTSRDEELISVQKMDSDGNPLWGERGIIAAPDISTIVHEQEDPQVIPTDDGGVVIVYNQLNDEYFLTLRAQRLDSSGEGLWSSEDGSGFEIVHGNTEDNIVKAIDKFPDGSIFVVYIKEFSEALYCQRIHLDGYNIWEEALLLDDNPGYSGMSVKTGRIGDNILVTYEKFEQIQVDIDILGKIICSDGEIFAEAELLNEDYRQIEPDIAIINDSFWLTWSDGRNDSDMNIYVQKYTADLVSVFPSSGLIVSSSDISHFEPKIIPDDNGGAYIAWSELYNDNTDIKFTHLNSDGSTATENYGQEGLPITFEEYDQRDIRIIPDGQGGLFAAWQDFKIIDKDVFSSIYMQRVNDWTVSVDNTPDNIPEGWGLENAYPNPFNPSTKISFNVGNASNVTLTVFDILGREVIKLVDGRRETGNHIVSWNGRSATGSSVSSGTYFYRLEAGDVLITKKMLLLK